VVERLASEEGIRLRSREALSRVGRGRISKIPVLLALPQTYMNASGDAVRALCQKNGFDLHDLCVVMDEIELPLGTLRMRSRGSAGGHQGLASVISAIGPGFPRLRVGVRGERYSRSEIDLADYVLAPVPKEERRLFEEAIERSAEALRIWITKGIDAAMRRANTRTSSPGPASDPD
jgi:peptidyl-tRNA hydrolase, PTH1 family